MDYEGDGVFHFIAGCVEVCYHPNTTYEMQAYVTKYINEGWVVVTLSEPIDTYQGYVRFRRDIDQERIDG